MWKDFLYFSKSQRIGVIVLIILILIVIILNMVLPFFFKDNYVDTKFLSEAKSFQKNLVLRDSNEKLERYRKYKENYQKYYTSEKYNVTAYKLFSFDPNLLDSVSFTQLGIKSYVTSNILKYRKKGGVFRSKIEFSKVYGISKEKYTELEPYITFKENKKHTSDSILVKQKIEKTNLIIDLNSSDTTQLMQIKGIGRYYANAIIRFRNTIGGFVSIEQLKEIKGMRSETYELIKPFCIVNLNFVKKINVNMASVDKLNSHPYLNFYQAKAIYHK